METSGSRRPVQASSRRNPQSSITPATKDYTPPEPRRQDLQKDQPETMDLVEQEAEIADSLEIEMWESIENILPSSEDLMTKDQMKRQMTLGRRRGLSRSTEEAFQVFKGAVLLHPVSGAIAVQHGRIRRRLIYLLFCRWKQR